MCGSDGNRVTVTVGTDCLLFCPDSVVLQADPWQIALPYQIISYFRNLFGSNSPVSNVPANNLELAVKPAQMVIVSYETSDTTWTRQINGSYSGRIGNKKDTMHLPSNFNQDSLRKIYQQNGNAGITIDIGGIGHFR